MCRVGSRGGGHPARAPHKIEKNMICWRKIVIFQHEYPNIFRVSLRSAQILDPPLKWTKLIIFMCLFNNFYMSINLKHSKSFIIITY